jgi:hypothetical protein
MSSKPDFRIRRTEANQASYEQLFCHIEGSFWGPTGTAKDKAYVAQGTPGQRALFVMTLFARLVDNGGLMSFFESAPFYSSEVSEALDLLQFPQMQKAFAEGLAVVRKEEPTPEDDESGRRMLDSLTLDSLTEDEIRKLDAINRRLYDGSGVEQRLFPYFKKYVDAHPEDFFRE